MSDYAWKRGAYRLTLWCRIRVLFGYIPPPRSTSTLKSIDEILSSSFAITSTDLPYRQNPFLAMVRDKDAG